jgi:hypothetical protein
MRKTSSQSKGTGARSRSGAADKGEPGGGKGRREEARGSGVYPMSGPWPRGQAKIQAQASWGQGARGAAGYQDHGDSGLDTTGAALTTAESSRPTTAESSSPPADQEIVRRQWSKFLDDFSRGHDGWTMEMDIIPGGDRNAIEVRDLPFHGLSLNSNNPRDRKVVVTFGDTAQDHLTHTVSRTKSIRFMSSDQRLEIESERGGRIVLRW